MVNTRNLKTEALRHARAARLCEGALNGMVEVLDEPRATGKGGTTVVRCIANAVDDHRREITRELCLDTIATLSRFVHSLSACAS